MSQRRGNSATARGRYGQHQPLNRVNVAIRCARVRRRIPARCAGFLTTLPRSLPEKTLSKAKLHHLFLVPSVLSQLYFVLVGPTFREPPEFTPSGAWPG